MLWFLSLIDCYYCHDIQSQTGATMGKWGRKSINGANVSENSSWNFEIPTGCGATSKICFKKKNHPQNLGKRCLSILTYWYMHIFQKGVEGNPTTKRTNPAIICSCRAPAQPLRVLKWLVRAIHEWSSGELRVWFQDDSVGGEIFTIWVSNLLKQIYNIYIYR